MDINNKIENNFRSIYSYIIERTGINLFDDQFGGQEEDVFNESTNVLEGTNGDTISSAIYEEIGRTPESIYEWMHKNISYDKRISDWKLKTPEEVYKYKKGNCHDQALFEAFMFHSLGIINGQLFFVEFSKNNSIGGNTHTLTWFRTAKKEAKLSADWKEPFKEENAAKGPFKYYWFENAWEDQSGIHGPYKNVGEIKDAILEIYRNDKVVNSHKYDGIVFSTLSNYRCGMTLEEYVGSWSLQDDHLFNESASEKYFRVTHDGIGIYEAMRRQISSKDWKKLLKSDNFTWLPKLKEYPPECRSYFTKDGMDKFNDLVYPIAAGIVGDNIKIEKFTADDISYIIYKDQYQIITSDNINDVINESLEWIERFVNDDEFRESVDEESDSIDVGVEGDNDEPFVPIYGIIKSYSHSQLRNDGSQKSDSELSSVKFDKIIHALTRGDNYSHALVSFDLSLTEMYSYEDEGFVVDNIMEKASWMGTKSIYICVMFVKKSERDRMKKFVEKLKEHPEETKYAMGNLIKAYIATPTKTDKRFVCSSFTGYIMACSNPKNLRRDYSRLRPDDIMLLPRAFYVTNCIDREDFKNRHQEIEDRVKSIYEEYKEDIDDYNNHLPKIMLSDRMDKLKTIDKIFDWIVNKLA